MRILCIDGGGSKCRALLASVENGRARALGEGLSAGVNETYVPRAQCDQNITDCVKSALASAPGPVARVFLSGPMRASRELLFPLTGAEEIKTISEGLSGILSGLLRRTGLAALSGTGSDVFYAPADGKGAVVGGWGLLLGDQGSGAWIGQQAAIRAIKSLEGWGEKTVLLERFMEYLEVDKRDFITDRVYHAPSPVRKLAGFVPSVARAAREGDAVALAVFREAGELMAAQMRCLMSRNIIPPEDRVCVCVGGAWRGHPAMLDAFRAALPDLPVFRPAFENVLAGVVLTMLNEQSAPEELRPALEEGFPDFKLER